MKVFTNDQLLSIIVTCGILFLVILGLIRVWELNSVYYTTVIEPWCKPKGFFGLGYRCNLTGYTQFIEFNKYNFTFINLTEIGIAQ